MERQEALESLGRPWDVIVIGGGINGAGVFRLAAASGLRTLLLEQRDFGWGASSRTGKLVHGGLRYLLQGQPRTTWHSVHERERLLRGYGGLVEGLGFLFPLSKHLRLAKPLVHLALTGYELMAGRWSYKFHRPAAFAMLAPRCDQGRLCGGFAFQDATADDARLVYRLLQEGRAMGGVAVNYCAARAFNRAPDGQARGLEAVDELTGRSYLARGRVILNASGAWTDDVRAHLGQRPRLRRLRGSHLILPRWRLPLGQAVGLQHPADGRAMYVMPWEGATLVGTTDIDHEQDMTADPRIQPEEGAYLLEALAYWFPSRGMGPGDVLSTYAGVRPVIDSGKKDPSKEPRDHAVWSEHGVVTMTGGKLTTFGLVARQGLTAAAKWLRLSRRVEGPGLVAPRPTAADQEALAALPPRQARRLLGRYGELAPLVAALGDGQVVAGTDVLLAELRWAAAHENVARLEDLMLRRTRLGLLSPDGGESVLDQIGAAIQAAAGWDEARWRKERQDYRRAWREAYSPGLLTC